MSLPKEIVFECEGRTWFLLHRSRGAWMRWGAGFNRLRDAKEWLKKNGYLAKDGSYGRRWIRKVKS